MKRIFIFTAVLLVFSGSAIFAFIKKPTSTSIQGSTNTIANIVSTNTSILESTNTNIAPPPPTNTNTTTPVPTVVVPIADFFNRITKKPFGIYITPKNSPIQPEKFTGYHTGADAETTPAEADIGIPIYSIANGSVVFAGHVNGYGGVIMIRYTIGTETVTTLYGHLRISSFTVKLGDTVNMGRQIAVLGTGYSSETDGERKHLHFGIIKGANINYKGYVSTQSQLSAWEDPVTWLKNGVGNGDI